jgi:hypothetical protein
MVTLVSWRVLGNLNTPFSNSESTVIEIQLMPSTDLQQSLLKEYQLISFAVAAGV